ncbi:hypothetical protein B0H14DRAFT_3424539 [Mycena olivaceomarginata]|nr:hypothetical protein B0H14DRAFT_3424539 [Mycena olivaceomarginata]
MAGSNVGKSSSRKSSALQKPYDRPRSEHQNPNHDAHFQQRNKYAHFDTPYMAVAIPSWRAVLAAVDRSLPSLCSAYPRNVYVFPKPALVISSDAPRDMYFHHYQLIRDALLYRLGNAEEPHDPVSAAEWRVALQGKVIAQGKHKSQVEKRTTTVERILGPALRACGIDTLDGFPVARVDVPPTTPARAKEITWELAEMNFRFDWTYRPDAVTFASERKPDYWTPTAITELEKCVAHYHTQALYHFFGRAAVVPLRLE